MATAFQENAFQIDVLAFQIEAAIPADIPLGGGGFWDYHHGERKGERWKKRRKQLDQLAARVAVLVETVPSDVPESTAVRAAVASVERAADTLRDPSDAFDWARLGAEVKAATMALKRAEKAMHVYHAAVEDEDDDDFLMMV